jgi:DNA repair exonuclease SbcCD ATPase subunit
MTEAQKELFVKTKERLRRMGKENPADVIVALAEEIEQYRAKIRAMVDELDFRCGVIRLLEQDIKDRDEMLEKKVEEVYADFMSDYKLMREELDGACEELTEAREAIEKLTRNLHACKADTVRKMQEMLEKEANYEICGCYCVSTEDIYQIANELLEGAKDESTTA